MIARLFFFSKQYDNSNELEAKFKFGEDFEATERKKQILVKICNLTIDIKYMS